MSRLPWGRSLPIEFGRYTLLERIGGGGMATVFRASLRVEGGFEKEVAVKLVRSELAEDPQFAQMFLDEARLAARLDHANIVQTFDFGQVEGLQYLAMELVRGGTLASLLRACRDEGRRLGTVPSLFIAKELARALDYAHRLHGTDGRTLGLIHRDVSPQNVLISREGEVKLTDFGIAKAALRSHLTLPGRVRGKCAYMAPEQARGADLDGRADVFALGIVLWESLTGASLFEGPSDAATLLQVIEKPIPPPSERAPGIPPEVDEAVLLLLERDPASRPNSGAAARLLADRVLQLSDTPAELDLAELQQRLLPGAPAREGTLETRFLREMEPDAPTRVPERAPPPAPVQAGETRTTADLSRKTVLLPRERRPLGRALRRWAAAGVAAVLALGGWALFAARGAPANAGPEAPVSGPAPLAAAAGEEVSTEAVPGGEGAVGGRGGAQPAEPEAPADVEVPSGDAAEAAGAPPSAPRAPGDVARQDARRPASSKSNDASAYRSKQQSAPSPTSPTRESPQAAQEGRLILSSRAAGGSVRVGQGDRLPLQPLVPRPLDLPAGAHRLTFQSEGEAGGCTLTLHLRAGSQRALLYVDGEVEELIGGARRRLPCD